MRRLLVAACAAMALALACVTGDLRSASAVDDGDGDAVCAVDTLEALPPPPVPQLTPPSSGGAVFVDLHFPPSRMTTAEVFRPPQARV